MEEKLNGIMTRERIRKPFIKQIAEDVRVRSLSDMKMTV